MGHLRKRVTELNSIDGSRALAEGLCNFNRAPGEVSSLSSDTKAWIN